jgi:hypothetical protein
VLATAGWWGRRSPDAQSSRPFSTLTYSGIGAGSMIEHQIHRNRIALVVLGAGNAKYAAELVDTGVNPGGRRPARADVPRLLVETCPTAAHDPLGNRLDHPAEPLEETCRSLPGQVVADVPDGSRARQRPVRLEPVPGVHHPCWRGPKLHGDCVDYLPAGLIGLELAVDGVEVGEQTGDACGVLGRAPTRRRQAQRLNEVPNIPWSSRRPLGDLLEATAEDRLEGPSRRLLAQDSLGLPGATQCVRQPQQGRGGVDGAHDFARLAARLRADFAERATKWAFFAASARWRRAAGGRRPSGSTWASNRAMNAARAGAVRRARSGVSAQDW